MQLAPSTVSHIQPCEPQSFVDRQWTGKVIPLQRMQICDLRTLVGLALKTRSGCTCTKGVLRMFLARVA